VAIERAHAILEQDERVRAAWLQGSFARGDADAWSDVDCHVAVADADFDTFAGEMHDVLERIAPVIGEIQVPLGVTRLLAATLETTEGLVRFDLAAERVGEASRPRQMQPVVLFDRDSVVDRFVVQPAATPEALRRRVQGLLSTFMFGAMWPVRLAGRGTHGTLLLNAISVVYSLIVPAILVRTRPEEAFREVLHVEHWLAPDDLARVNTLVAELHAAFAGVGEHRMDGDRLAMAHQHLTSMALRELRGACEATGVEWPVRSEAVYRAYYRRELGIDLHS